MCLIDETGCGCNGQAEELMEIMESNNEPVAWMAKDGTCVSDEFRNKFPHTKEDYSIPLYTHPAKTQSHTETAVKILNYLGYSQEPSREEGADARRDKLVEIISKAHPAKTLTDDEMLIDFARAILKKASEK
jgi:hypothetical protein